MSGRKWAGALLACALLPPGLHGGLSAQEASTPPLELNPTLRIEPGPRGGGGPWGLFVGTAVSFIGDVDGDAVSDLAIGSTGLITLQTRGTLRLHSGADGSLIRLTLGRSAWFAASLARVGDIDGDGVPDVLAADQTTAADGSTRALVIACSGADMHQIWAQDLGPGHYPVLDWAQDLDGDDIDDAFAIGTGGLQALSGRSGRVLFRRPASDLGLEPGSLATLGDLDGDGLDDVLVGAPSSPAWHPVVLGNRRALAQYMSPGHFGRYHVGAAVALSGADGSTLYALRGRLARGGRFGSIVVALGDVDGDGVTDAAIKSDRGGSPDERGNSAPWVRIISGRDGVTLREFDIPRAIHGTNIGVVGDVDGDGVPDLATGGSDTVEVHSGRDGAVIARRTVVNPYFPGGWPGYGWRTLGGQRDCHDHPVDFLVVASNWFGEGFLEFFENPP